MVATLVSWRKPRAGPGKQAEPSLSVPKTFHSLFLFFSHPIQLIKEEISAQNNYDGQGRYFRQPTLKSNGVQSSTSVTVPVPTSMPL